MVFQWQLVAPQTKKRCGPIEWSVFLSTGSLVGLMAVLNDDFSDNPETRSAIFLSPSLLLMVADLFQRQTGERPSDFESLTHWAVENRKGIGKFLTESLTVVGSVNSTGCEGLPDLTFEHWRQVRSAIAQFLVPLGKHGMKRSRRQALRQWLRKTFFKSMVSTKASLDLEKVLSILLTVGGPSSPGELDKSTSNVDSISRANPGFVGHEPLQNEKLRSLRWLAYGASHEINNPLANIAMRAEALSRSEPDTQRKSKLRLIQQQAMRAHHMISDMMLFANPPQPQLTRTSFAEIVESVCGIHAQELNLRNIKTLTSVSAEAVVWVDRKQMIELLSALVLNAMESIGHSGTISIETTESEAKTGISITDSGQGIAEDILPAIFDPFFSGREAGRGLGFGLAKAWRIAQLHEGQLECVSPEPGHTVFHLTLPANNRLHPKT